MFTALPTEIKVHILSFIDACTMYTLINYLPALAPYLFVILKSLLRNVEQEQLLTCFKHLFIQGRICAECMQPKDQPYVIRSIPALAEERSVGLIEQSLISTVHCLYRKKETRKEKVYYWRPEKISWQQALARSICDHCYLTIVAHREQMLLLNHSNSLPGQVNQKKVKKLKRIHSQDNGLRKKRKIDSKQQTYCQAITKKGVRCPWRAQKGSNCCGHHK